MTDSRIDDLPPVSEEHDTDERTQSDQQPDDAALRPSAEMQPPFALSEAEAAGPSPAAASAAARADDDDDIDEDEEQDLPPWQRVLLLAGSLAMAYFAQVNLFRDPPDAVYSGYMLIFGLGVVNFFINIFGLLRTSILQDGGLFETFPKKHVQRYRLSVVWLVIAIAIMSYASWRTVQRPPEAYLWEYIILAVLGTGSFFIAIRISKKSHKAADTLPFLRWEIIAMLLLLAAAVAIRGINLNDLPYNLDQDEGAFAREGAVLALDEDYRSSPYEIGTYSYTRWHQMMIGISTAVFGVDKFAARFPSMVMGSLTVLAVYLLGRELYGRKVGLVAALFMLTWVFHAHFSRLALNQPGDPLFSTLAIYFMLRGLRMRTVMNYVYSGLFLGIAQFFYLGARLAPILMVLYLVFMVIRQRSVILPQWKLILLIPLTAFIVTMPQNYFIYYFREPFTTRFDKSIFNDSYPAAVENGTVVDFMRRQIVFSFTSFITSSDRGGWYGVGSNLMGPFGGPLFVIGAFGVLLLFWARPKWVLPLAWGLGVVLGGGVINNSPPAYERYHPGVAAFALLVAFGIWLVAESAVGLLQRRKHATAVLIGLGVVVCVLNLAFYLFDYIPMGNYFNNRPNWQTNAVSREAVSAYQAGRRVILLGGYETGVDDTNVLRYFMVGRPYAFLPNAFPPDPNDPAFKTIMEPGSPLTFIVARSRSTDLPLLRQQWPGGTEREVQLTEDKSLAFYVYETPATPQTGRK